MWYSFRSFPIVIFQENQSRDADFAELGHGVLS